MFIKNRPLNRQAWWRQNKATLRHFVFDKRHPSLGLGIELYDTLRKGVKGCKQNKGKEGKWEKKTSGRQPFVNGSH